MSEEMDKRGAELSEQALEGVSGGIMPSRAQELAKKVCQSCERRGTPNCTGGEKELVRYMLSYGTVVDPYKCPLRKSEVESVG